MTKSAMQPPRQAKAQGSPLPRLLTPPLALPPPSPSAAAARQWPADASSDSLVDAGLMLGQTSRAGWGPSGVFAHVGESSCCATVPSTFSRPACRS